MVRMLGSILLALGLALASPASALAQGRAYAPENLSSLPYRDQVRVIGLEYSDQSGGRRIPDDQLRFYTDQVNRSNWTFSQVRHDIAQSLAGSTYPPRPPAGGEVLRCESNSNRPNTCQTLWRGHSRLVRQLSGSPCIEGRSWQSRDGHIYVSGGCRGEFQRDAQVQPPIAGGNVRCESVDNRARSCQVPWRGRTRLVRQLSSSPCIEGRTWESRRGQVHVDQGCRGEFAAVAGGLPGPGPGLPSGYSVACDSYKGASTTCDWDRAFGQPRLIQQLSDAPCIEGRSWGYDLQIGLWVTDGCRGRFAPY
ncbi:DUF3011 domain-containing protein [Luteimonas vadosa]|uniref:DUF3011 domain-containing protein n=1 Tax=Luteimonas vadosa TaxID=1165507 RepID=A0ABP9DRX4_9GAMM